MCSGVLRVSRPLRAGECRPLEHLYSSMHKYGQSFKMYQHDWKITQINFFHIWFIPAKPSNFFSVSLLFFLRCIYLHNLLISAQLVSYLLWIPAELVTKQALFPGDSELQQILLIFRSNLASTSASSWFPLLWHLSLLLFSSELWC